MSAVPQDSASSESEGGGNVHVANTEVYDGQALADAKPRTPEVDPFAGSPSSAAPVQSAPRQGNVARRNFRENLGRTDANSRTPVVGSANGSPSSAAPVSSVSGSFKGLVIWNKAYRPQQDSDAEHSWTRPPGRRPGSDRWSDRREGFWSHGSNNPSWRT